MKKIIALEEVAMFLTAIFIYSKLSCSGWLFPVLLLLPDVSIIGYMINNKWGAIIYNVVHHKGLGLFCFMAGFDLNISYLQLCGIILFAHSSMDRIFGFGLKYTDNFKHTHLG